MILFYLWLKIKEVLDTLEVTMSKADVYIGLCAVTYWFEECPRSIAVGITSLTLV
jgi:hypothetical protein